MAAVWVTARPGQCVEELMLSTKSSSSFFVGTISSMMIAMCLIEKVPSFRDSWLEASPLSRGSRRGLAPFVPTGLYGAGAPIHANTLAPGNDLTRTAARKD